MGIRVLVVDDASFIRDMVKRQLREHIPGVEVLDAVDGNRAMAALKQHPIDLILSDWEMPGMSGEELLRWVRSESHLSSIPFVMVTSRGDRSHVVKAVEAGVSDYLTKPFTAEELVKKAIKHLRRAGKDLAEPRSTGGNTQGIAFASVDVLTGGAAPIQKTAEPVRASRSTAQVSPARKAPSKKVVNSRAQLRFPGGITCTCVVKDLTLQACSGLIPRTESLPQLFEQAVVDIESDQGDQVARLNGYIHSLQAAENRVDTRVVKVNIRFVDNDPEKFEFLSQYIAKI